MSVIKDNTKLLLFGQNTERLLFRQLEPSDFDTWLKFCEYPNSLKYIWPSNEDSAYEKCRIWFEKIFHRYKNHLGGLNALVSLENGSFIGQCGLLIHTVDGIDELEIGYSLMPKQRGKGYATEAAKKCRNYTFENNLAESLISIVHIDNKESEKVALNNGMTLDKQTTYNNIKVNIFRLTKPDWHKEK